MKQFNFSLAYLRSCAKHQSFSIYLKINKNPRYSPSRKLFLNVFTAVICSKIDHKVLAYSVASKIILNQLKTIENVTIHTSIGALKSFPICSIYRWSSTTTFVTSQKVTSQYLSFVFDNKNPFTKRIARSTRKPYV